MTGGAKDALLRRDDIVPAHLFGPGHCSLTYGLEIDGAVGPSHTFRDQVITNEINRANSTQLRQKFGETKSDTVRQWLTEKGAQHAAAAYRCKFVAKKRLYQERELIGAFDAYTVRTQYEGKRKYQARWKALFALRKLMASKDGRPLGAPPIRLAGGDRALYEQMFRAEPRIHVSRPTFMTVMRRVYGFQTAPLAGHVDQTSLHKLGEVYSTFDVDGHGKVDWRCMVFMLRVAMNAQATVEENLKWGFALYSSPGSFDPECDDPVPMSDFKNLVNTMARFETLIELNNIFDEAWKAVAADDYEAGRLAAAATGRGTGREKPRKPLEITMRLLTLMLRQRPLKDLLRPATRFGLRDRGTWTYAIEEAFFDPLLLALIKQKRRDQRNDVATSIFLDNTRRRAILVRIAMWKRLVRRRKHCVILMMRIGGRFCRGNSSSAFRAIQRRAIACKACETIQRVYRGYLARLVAEFLRVLVRRVITTQAVYRGVRQRRKFLSWMSTKHLAATCVQRFFRGALGRKRAGCLLQEYFDREMAAVDAEVERMEYRSRHKAASKLQRLWRTRRDRRRDEAEKLRRIKIHEVEAEMEQILAREAREAEVYKRQLSAWFKEQKKEQDESRLLEEHTAKEKFKIVSYRRRERDRIAAETRRRKQAAAERFEEQRIEQWQMEWAEKGENRAIAHRKMLEAALAHPDNEPEKALQKSLKAEIEAQTKVVLKMADDVEADLEAPEAYQIAKEEILLSKMDQERERVNEEMKVAAAKYMEEEARVKADKEEKMTKYRDSAQDAAARVIQQLYYVFSATRTTQKRAKEVYTKHYDSENMAYYWYNKEIGTYLWKKPSGLGGWDVDPEDRWQAIPGSYGLNYYFNPKTCVMQWPQPAGTVVCKECNVQFSTCWCNRDVKPYCETCYNNRHFSEESPSAGPLLYKALDGAVPGSQDLIDFDYISDQPDIEVEAWGNSELAVTTAGPEALSDEYSEGNHGDTDVGQQQLVGPVGTAGLQDPSTPSGEILSEQPAVVPEGGQRRHTGGSEIEEYLDSQQTFSYDGLSRDASAPAGAGGAREGAEFSTDDAGRTEEHVFQRLERNTNSSPGNDRGSRTSDYHDESTGVAHGENGAWAKAGATTNADGGAAILHAEVEGGGTPIADSFQEDCRVGNRVDEREGKSVILIVEAGEYDCLTPSYGLDG